MKKIQTAPEMFLSQGRSTGTTERNRDWGSGERIARSAAGANQGKTKAKRLFEFK
jgi:hypothetical protein